MKAGRIKGGWHNVMLTLKRLPWPFTGSRGASPLPPSITSTPASKSLNTFYHTDDIPLHNFIECFLSGDRTLLMREGSHKAAVSDLEEAWHGIYADYIDAVGGNNLTASVTLWDKIKRLELRITTITIALAELRQRKSEVIIEALRKAGYRFDEDKYNESIERIAKQAGGLGLELKVKQAEFLRLKEQAGDGKATRQHFDDMITAVERHMGFMIDKHNVTLGKFLSMVRNMITSNKAA